MTGTEKKGRGSRAAVKILIAGFGWGIIGVFSRPLSAAGLSAVQVTLVRSLIVAVGMFCYISVTDRSLLRIQWKDLWIFLGTGLLSIVFFNVCYFLTIQKATLAAASILLYTAPCFVLLMSAVFFHEKITMQKIAALVLAFSGCALVSGLFGGGSGTGGGGGQMPFGAVLTGIGSGLGYALYSIFGSVALKKYQPFTLIFYTFFIASLGLLPFAGAAEIGTVVFQTEGLVVYALALGVISTFLPFVFYTNGLKEMEAGKASVLAFAEPMVATMAGIVIFKEALYLQNALGIVMIFCAILLLNIPLGQKEKSK